MSDIAVTLGADVFAKALLAVATILAIRFLPVAEYAHYTVLLAVGSVVGQAVTGVLDRFYIVGQRELPADNLEPSLAVLYLGLPLLLSQVMWFLPMVGDGAVLVATAFAVSICLLQQAKVIHQRRLRFASFSMIELSKSAAFLLGLGAYVVLAAPRAQGVLLIQSLTMIVVALPTLILSVRWSQASLAGINALARKLLGRRYRGLVLFVLLASVFPQTGILITSVALGTEDLAEFGAAHRYYLLLTLVLAATHVVLLPRMAQAKDKAGIMSNLGEYRRVLLAAVPLVLVSIALSPLIMPWLDDGKYPNAPVVFQILALGALVSMVLSPFVNVLMRWEAYDYVAGVVAFGLLFYLALGVPLANWLGPPGVAMATLAAYAFVDGMFFVRARRLLAADAEPPGIVP